MKLTWVNTGLNESVNQSYLVSSLPRARRAPGASAGADGVRRRGAARALIIVFAYSCCCCARASLAENRALAVLVE